VRETESLIIKDHGPAPLREVEDRLLVAQSTSQAAKYIEGQAASRKDAYQEY